MIKLKIIILSMMVALMPSMSMSNTDKPRPDVVGEVWVVTVSVEHTTKDYLNGILEKVMVDTEETCELAKVQGSKEEVDRSLKHAWLTEDGYNRIDGDGYYIYKFNCERFDIYGFKGDK